MNINFKQLFVPEYLFTRFVPPLSRDFFMVWISGGVGFFIAGFIVRIVSSRAHLIPVWVRWWKRVGTMLSTMGFLALLFLFFRTEDVPMLSSRVWMMAWFVGLVLWTLSLAFTAWKEIPKQAAVYQEQQRIRKYLPHK